MEFVTHRREDGTFQPLKEHIENVGERAAQFAAAFDAAEHGREAGLLHDIGKYSSNATRSIRPRSIIPARGRRRRFAAKTPWRPLPWRGIMAACRILEAEETRTAVRFAQG
mgnify:CR=1 FL=1